MNGVVGSTLFCLIGGLLLVVVIAVFNMIRVVPEYQRLVVFLEARVVLSQCFNFGGHRRDIGGQGLNGVSGRIGIGGRRHRHRAECRR